MEKYVVSRELAEKLKAAGYPQKTQFSHEPIGSAWAVMALHDCVLGRSIAAPMSDELLEQLPKTIVNGHYFMLTESIGEWSVGYAACGEFYFESFDSSKLADALASLWLWCKEHNYV